MMKPNVNTAVAVLTLMATSRVRLDEARVLRYTDKGEALTKAREAYEIAAQAKRLLTR